MRILHVSDFHARWAWFEWLAKEGGKFDMVIYTGDFLNLFGSEPLGAQVTRVTAWARTFPVPFLWCPGNHDTDTGARPVSSGRWLETLSGRHFFNTAGLASRLGATFARIDWQQPIPEQKDCRFVLAHAPPAGCRTAISAVGNSDLGNFQLGEALRAAATRVPAIVLSGHVHTPVNWFDRCGSAWSFNPGINPDTRLPSHIVIDTEKRKAWWLPDGELAGAVDL
jgi:predicted phosphodiesterase